MIDVREIVEKSDDKSTVLEFFHTEGRMIMGKSKLEIIKIIEAEGYDYNLIAQTEKNYDGSLFKVRVFNK